MLYIINSIEELEKLINDRIYVDNLDIYNQQHIEPHLKCLTNLTQLHMDGCNISDVDLSLFSNLVNLKIYNKNNISVSKLSNLTFLQTFANFSIDFSLLTNLKILLLWTTQDTDISMLTNLTYLSLCTSDNNNIKFPNLENLESLELFNNVQSVDFTLLSNLTYLYLRNFRQNQMDFSKCEKLKKVCFSINNDTKYHKILQDDEKIGIVDWSKINESYLDSCVIKK